MDVGSVEAVLLALMLLVPGGVGDLVMRSVTNMPEPRSDFGRLLSAMSWSTASLAACEALWAILRRGPFGTYLLDQVIAAESLTSITGIAPRYLGYILVASVMPALVRWVARRRVVEIVVFRRRTLLEPGLDRLFDKYKPAPPEGTKWGSFARVRVADAIVEGWVKWTLSGDTPEAGVILQNVETDSAIWIPMAEVKRLELVDLRYDLDLQDRIHDAIGTPRTESDAGPCHGHLQNPPA